MKKEERKNWCIFLFNHTLDVFLIIPMFFGQLYVDEEEKGEEEEADGYIWQRGARLACKHDWPTD